MRSEAKTHVAFSYVASLRQAWLPCGKRTRNRRNGSGEKTIRRM